MYDHVKKSSVLKNKWGYNSYYGMFTVWLYTGYT